MSVPLGKHTITLAVDDGQGHVATDTATVNVVDRTPPRIEAIAAVPNALWPRNHRMHPVRLEVSLRDVCDALPHCRIVSVSSSEPETGRHDDTAPDWVVTGRLTLNLRAERSPHGDGRDYTIKVRCTDHRGNITVRRVVVKVYGKRH